MTISEKKISTVVEGKEKMAFKLKVDEHTGYCQFLFKGRDGVFSMTMEELLKALERENVLKLFMLKLLYVAKKLKNPQIKVHSKE